MSDKKFAQLYRMRFGVLDPGEIARKYDGMILTAWEGYEDRNKLIPRMSHRHLIAEWLRENGFQCEELVPMKRKRRVL